MKNQNRAILWALDPFELEVRPDPKAVAQLVTWAKARGFDIQPVFVLSRPSLDLAKYAGDSLSNFVMASMRNKVNVYLSSLGVDHAKPCEVILAHSTAREEAIQEILRLAESYCSPWVIVSSHGRSGLSRLAFGSFAEALVMQSKFPILFLPRTHHDNAQMNRLLFPTDFSSASHALLFKCLAGFELCSHGCTCRVANRISGRRREESSVRGWTLDSRGKGAKCGS
jgi:nucleotide-binding universal stress UspA family protein